MPGLNVSVLGKNCPECRAGGRVREWRETSDTHTHTHLSVCHQAGKSRHSLELKNYTDQTHSFFFERLACIGIMRTLRETPRENHSSIWYLEV